MATTSSASCSTRIRLAAVLCVLGCVPVANLSCRKEEPPPPPSLRVRLLSSAPPSSRWQRDVDVGLQRIAVELEAEVSSARVDDDSERRARLQELPEAGMDLVFCVGAGFDPMVYTEASANPDTRFVLFPGGGHAANLAGIVFQVEGAAYLGGVLAGVLSEQPMAGVLHGEGGPWLEGAADGFLGGFRSVHGDGEVVVADGADGAWELATQGVAVALYLADGAETEVLTAAHNAGLLLVVTDVEALTVEPETVVAAVTVDMPEAMVRLVREVRDGTFRGRAYAFDLGSGVMNLRLGPLLDQSPDPAVYEALEIARAEVTAGIVELERLGI
jgi:basic membrane lipoprotein Med (substrate-binding protein (PBP1-ABC) superfamily)